MKCLITGACDLLQSVINPESETVAAQSVASVKKVVAESICGLCIAGCLERGEPLPHPILVPVGYTVLPNVQPWVAIEVAR
jgi:hypothetical protein